MLKIVNVNVNTNRSWNDIKDKNNWSSLFIDYRTWGQARQTTIVGNLVSIEVDIVESNWLYIMNNNTSWTDIMNKYLDWDEVKKNIRAGD